MRYRRSTYHLMAFFLFWVGTFLIFPLQAAAQAKPMERDTDIVFDEQERSLTMERDTTDDGRFDTRYEFVEGHVARSTRDTDADETVNVWTTYRKDFPVEQKTDGNGDGRIERVVLFDESGQPHLSRHDMDDSGTFETVRHYVAGEITRQEKDSRGSGRSDGDSQQGREGNGHRQGRRGRPAVPGHGKEMVSIMDRTTGGNWLFSTLIIISVGVHAMLLLHLSSVYRSRTLTTIEMSLQNMDQTPIQ